MKDKKIFIAVTDGDDREYYGLEERTFLIKDGDDEHRLTVRKNDSDDLTSILVMSEQSCRKAIARVLDCDASQVRVVYRPKTLRK